MKKNITTMMVFVVLVLSSCSKDTRISNMLHRSDGNWKIASANYTLVISEDASVITTLNGTITDAGSFVFDKEGSGSYSLTIGTSTYGQSFAWAVSDESISLTKLSQTVDFFTGDVEQIVVAYSGTKTDKKQITLSGAETVQSTSDMSITQQVLTLTDMVLKKE